MTRWVEITFDCLPLRTIERLDIPIDASPKYQAFCERLKAALEKHGAHNTYYLHNARCTFHFTNDPELGVVTFAVEGVVMTDADDLKTEQSDLRIKLHRETCDWLSEPIVDWLTETTRQAVKVEFDRYIAAGDLDAAKQRMEEIEKASDDAGGFMGMYL